MLRVREIEIGGTKYRIGNLTLGAQRQFAEAFEGKDSTVSLQKATSAVVLAALKRADPSVEVDFDQLDADDMKQLFGAVWEWAQPRDPTPAPSGEPKSP